jgi:alpha-L-arabinofuranosidase
MVFRPAGLPEIRVTRCRRDRPHSKRFAHCTNSWRDVSSRAILWTLIPAALLLLPWLQAQGEAAPAAKLTIQVDKPGHKIPPTLWGIFFEDINLSADGGIYPELVRNRSFEDSGKPDHWRLVKQGNSTSEMAIDSEKPLNPFNRRSLRVRVDGSALLVNEGYWGMNIVKGNVYRLRLAARAADGFRGPLPVVLETKEGNLLAGADISELTDQWKYYSADLTAEASDPHGRLTLSARGKGTLWLDMISLMPVETWKGHGLRADLCEKLASLKPAFMRFPGGCWVEGDDLQHSYHWKETIGDIAERKPLYNLWGYWATHGLGFHEYLQLSEDLRAEPLFCLNVGMSHKEVVPLDRMGQWVQDALDALEYANGPTTSVWGRLRAKNGHPAPFGLKYLEIGNENGGPPYYERWRLFHDAIKSKHPDIQLIADVWEGYPTNAPPDIVDEHYYDSPEFFMRQAGRYDTYDRKGPRIFIGEYAVTKGCGQGNLRAAMGEAAFMTGLERNSDIVVMASYAPLFVHVNHRRWTPDLINFDSSRSYGLPSYYAQQMFSRNRGDVVLPVTVDAPLVAGAQRSGGIGIGTWRTRAEFKDIKVTHNGQTLYSAGFTRGTNGWDLLGGGDWHPREGGLSQLSEKENVRAATGDKAWADYNYSLKARKLGGAEGFLILFHVQDAATPSWWNLGGWGNTHHGIEMGGIVTQEAGSIETGRWYDIRIELKGTNIKCYLDGKLIHDVGTPSYKSLFAAASRDNASGEVILKVVNVSESALATQISFKGAKELDRTVQASVLAADKPSDENSLDYPEKVIPKTQALQMHEAALNHLFPANSVTVLRCGTK